jgi:uncharacterized protein (TIGR03067 family)
MHMTRSHVWSAMLAMLAASLPAFAQVYKSTDPSGRVIYSDRPPPGSSASRTDSSPASRIAPGPSVRDLQGTWQVVSILFEGVPRADHKQIAAKWSFGPGELSIERATGETARYSVRMDAASQPPAFFATPLAPTVDRGAWMLYAREGERLRIALFDGGQERPTGFEPQRKLAVFTLVPLGSALARDGTRSACQVLRAAGVVELLGNEASFDDTRKDAPVTQCVVQQPFGLVGLVMLPMTPRTALDRQREREARDAPQRAARTVVLDEPELGPSAFSVRSGNRVQLWAHRGESAVVLQVVVPDGDRGKIVPFAKRVLAQL